MLARSKNRNVQPGFISKRVDRLMGRRTARMKSVREMGRKRERDCQSGRERELGERERTLVCGRIRRDCDRAREGKSDRVREKEKEERMRRNDCRFGKSLSQQTAVHSALL